MTATTLGVEEEFHLVDPATGALVASPAVADAAVLGQAGEHVQPEISQTQLETATGVLTTLDGVRAALLQTRAEAVVAAQTAGLTVLAASTHPTAVLADLVLTDAPRYRVMVQRWASLATGRTSAAPTCTSASTTWTPPSTSWTVPAPTCRCSWR